MDMAFGYRLDPPFEPYYIGSLNFLLACSSYVIPYLGINGYVGTDPIIDGYTSKRVGGPRLRFLTNTSLINRQEAAGHSIDDEQLVAGLLGVEAGQGAVFRGLLFERLGETVPPYRNIAVAEFTDRVSALRNRLGRCGGEGRGRGSPCRGSHLHQRAIRRLRLARSPTRARRPSCSGSSTSRATRTCQAGSTRRAPTGGSRGNFLASRIAS
jgi:hypothetical protein